MTYVSNMLVSLSEGDWHSARDSCDRGLDSMPRHTSLLSFRALVEYNTGDFGQGEDYLKRFLEAKSLIPGGPSYENAATAMFIPIIARMTGVADRFDIAVSAAETVLSSPAAGPGFVNWARAGLALIAAHQADAASAEEHYDALKSARGTWAPGSLMVMDHVLGLISVTMVQLDQAVVHFEDVLTLYQIAGYRPELAWTCCDYADALRERDGEGDRAKAMSLLDESLAISSELGMRPLTERVLSRREILGA